MDRPYDANDDRDLLYPSAETIRAFAPSSDNILEASNLRFLSSLDVSVETRVEEIDDIVEVGFTMSSRKEDDKYLLVLDTAGMNWSSKDKVSDAYIEAVELYFLAEGLPPMKGLTCPSSMAAIYELAGLICVVATHCPQLTSHT